MKAKTNIYFASLFILNGLSSSALGFAFGEHLIADTLQEIQDIYAIDIDGDGDIDIISTDMDDPGSGRVIWWENENNGEFDPHILAEELSYTRGCHAIDFDDDGDVDIFVAGGEDDVDHEGNIGNVYYFENDGDQDFEQHLLFDSFHGAAEVEAGDLDDDGYLNILLLSSIHFGFGFNVGIIAWYENEGDGEFVQHEIYRGRAKSAAPLTDIDSDGDLDIFGVDNYIGGDYTIWLENDGDGDFEVHEFDEFHSARNVPGVIDLNQDGDVDLLIGDYWGDGNENILYWLENDGEDEFEAHGIAIDFIDGVRDFDIIDFDADEDYDLIIAGQNREGADFAILENDGEQNFEPVSISNEHLRPEKTIAADVDGDDDIDIFLSAGGGRLSWWEQTSAVTLQLAEGWNIYSSHLDPGNPDIPFIFAQPVERGTVQLVKDNEGRFYNPKFDFNNIPFWDFRQGYLVKMNTPDSVVIAGDEVAVDTAIPLAEGWNMVAYFPDTEIEAPDAFANIEDVLIHAKDGEGHFYLPAREFNNIPPLQRGLGYQVKVREAVDLVWNIQE